MLAALPRQRRTRPGRDAARASQHQAPPPRAARAASARKQRSAPTQSRARCLRPPYGRQRGSASPRPRASPPPASGGKERRSAARRCPRPHALPQTAPQPAGGKWLPRSQAPPASRAASQQLAVGERGAAPVAAFGRHRPQPHPPPQAEGSGAAPHPPLTRPQACAPPRASAYILPTRPLVRREPGQPQSHPSVSARWFLSPQGSHAGQEQSKQTRRLCTSKIKDRMIWVGRDLKAHLVPPPSTGRDTSHWIRLLKAPSNLALSTSRDRAAPTSLGVLCQCLSTLTGKHFFVISNLNLSSFSFNSAMQHFGSLLFIFLR
ncbi:translation initiation factor IF-2-like [Cuculus canorus]|uniref:translation initiation factor IF-2-like n=1 Tax=Cuculus canorus TaxID=55661 RepID=UPI0023AB5267|nr:translation initiation factor IF-2-like [Cuculus canorus]XP_053913582.1 translation initiation factor IF-2-like [Cuculus canorus]XP_053913583.1 translation initiation factor IF-2-like [Cuculus canorus]XP_053913584.1 translation initiation factor IF-2-like [Cuculus canorus]XP_053913585.1 translation initiation factor IF-2-like [Cuculus canorus]XP_053913586.1 translation initiation factor IF-2-like [Cuculus canorus]